MNNFSLRPQDRASVLSQAAFGLLLLALLLFGAPVSAETVSVEPMEPLSAEELGELVGPIALYPDDLVAIVLPASTYPLQIVQAVRFLEARKDDDSLEPSEDWDDSVIALLNYPEVLDLMNNDLDWTWKLGEAVLIQQEEVIVAIADFRERARVAGNLESDEHQIVEVLDGGSIQITPADPKVIYVPYYEPAQMTVYNDYPVYHYYPRAYPVYYYPYPADYGFSSGYFWGVTSAFSIGWSTHHLHVNHYGYSGHPYYGHAYYDHHYYRRAYLSLSHDDHYGYGAHHAQGAYTHHAGNYWQPGNDRHGASPRYRNRHNLRLDRYNDDRSDSYRRQDRHPHQGDGGSGSSFDGERAAQHQPLVAHGGVDATASQRRQPRARPTRARPTRARPNPARTVGAVSARVPGRKTRVIAQRTSHRSGLPSARVTRAASKADRAHSRERRDRRQARPVMNVPNADRKRTTVARRAARPAVVRQARVQSPARQQARVSLPQARPSQTRPRQSSPQRPQPQRSQRQQPSQPRQVASAHKHGRAAANRSNRAQHHSARTSFRALR